MKTKEELQAMAQLVRIHESNCELMFPTPEETSFRLAIMKKLAQELGLKELRAARIDDSSAQNLARTRREP